MLCCKMDSQHFGHVVDLKAKRIFSACVSVKNGRIASIEHADLAGKAHTYLLPGFIDAHIHIESSLLSPQQFARAACLHGTLGCICDPHEIANVLGMPGVEWMMADAAKAAIPCKFGAPSCVPASTFESNNANFKAEQIAELFDRLGCSHLAEVMDYPAVLQQQPRMQAILAEARKRALVIDGHAPALAGEDLQRYHAAGIVNDHEAVSAKEAEERMRLGMLVFARMGSAARDLPALLPALRANPGKYCFCSDDKHPDDLQRGHINRLVSYCVKHGLALMDALQAACITPKEHYGLELGSLQVGDSADFIRVRDLSDFEVLESWRGGRLIAGDGVCHHPLHTAKQPAPNIMQASPLGPEDLHYTPLSRRPEALPVIGCSDGSIITEHRYVERRHFDPQLQYAAGHDVAKLLVLNRYRSGCKPALAHVQGLGLGAGCAMAGSVAHDSHNIIAAGSCDAALLKAVNRVIELGGGLVAVYGEQCLELALPVAGLMSEQHPDRVAARFSQLTALIRQAGSTHQSPFMSLSFLALLVIPQLKLSDLGLFDVQKFDFYR